MGRETILMSKDGKVFGANPRRLKEQPFWLCPNPPSNSISMVANQVSAPTFMTVSGVGPLQVVAFAHEKLGNCRVMMKIQDGKDFRGLMNSAVDVDTIFGTGAQPYRLPEALFLDYTRAIQMEVTDYSGSSNTIQPAFMCQKYLGTTVYEGEESIKRQTAEVKYMSTPYWYTFEQGVITLSGGASIDEYISIEEGAHFQLMQLSKKGTGSFDLDIIEVASGESLIDAPQGVHFPIDSDLICGNGNFPFKFHEPRLFAAGQKILVRLTDTSGSPNTISVTLGGRALAARNWS